MCMRPDCTHELSYQEAKAQAILDSIEYITSTAIKVVTDALESEQFTYSLKDAKEYLEEAIKGIVADDWIEASSIMDAYHEMEAL